MIALKPPAALRAYGDHPACRDVGRSGLVRLRLHGVYRVRSRVYGNAAVLARGSATQVVVGVEALAVRGNARGVRPGVLP